MADLFLASTKIINLFGAGFFVFMPLSLLGAFAFSVYSAMETDSGAEELKDVNSVATETGGAENSLVIPLYLFAINKRRFLEQIDDLEQLSVKPLDIKKLRAYLDYDGTGSSLFFKADLHDDAIKLNHAVLDELPASFFKSESLNTKTAPHNYLLLFSSLIRLRNALVELDKRYRNPQTRELELSSSKMKQVKQYFDLVILLGSILDLLLVSNLFKGNASLIIIDKLIKSNGYQRYQTVVGNFLTKTNWATELLTDPANSIATASFMQELLSVLPNVLALANNLSQKIVAYLEAHNQIDVLPVSFAKAYQKRLRQVDLKLHQKG